MGDPRHRLGLDAEMLVARWLATAGWTVLERRWRPRDGGEVDLVCRDPRDALVGVEVRARSSARAGTPAESVDRRKVSRLRSALATYAAASRGHSGLRIDLVTVEQMADGRWRLTRHPAIDGW
jgi:Holliday junction resolvase-like predicted endonuclease